MFSLLVKREGLPPHVWWLWCVLSNRIGDLCDDDCRAITDFLNTTKEPGCRMPEVNICDVIIDYEERIRTLEEQLANESGKCQSCEAEPFDGVRAAIDRLKRIECRYFGVQSVLHQDDADAILVLTARIRTIEAQLAEAKAENERLSNVVIEVNRIGKMLIEPLGKFVRDALEAGHPLTTTLELHMEDTQPETILHLWATVDDKEPVARVRQLAKARDMAIQRADMAEATVAALSADHGRVAEIEREACAKMAADFASNDAKCTAGNSIAAAIRNRSNENAAEALKESTDAAI